MAGRHQHSLRLLKLEATPLSFLALPCVRRGAIGTASASQHLRVLATLGSLADIRKIVYPMIFG
jgi:hypothetical protein